MDRHEPPRPYGLGTATFVVVSSMVGTGVLTTSGYLILDLRHGPSVLALWAIGGLVALCGALTLAELAAALPRSGGEFVILQEAYGPRLAFLAGWVSLGLGFAAPIAANALAAATYLFDFLGAPAMPPWPRVFATALLVIVALVHVSGPSATARFQAGVTLATLALLTLFVAAGLTVRHPQPRPSSPLPTFDAHFALAWFTGLVYVSYAFTGWNGAAYLGGEVHNPGHRLPRAILTGTLLVTALYVGLNLVYVRAVAPAALAELAARAGRDAVQPIAELAARELFGPAWARRLAGLVGLILLGSLSALVLTGPRVAAAMADVQQLPGFVGRRSARNHAPVYATVLLAAVAAGLLWTGSFEALIVFAAVGLGLFSLPTVAAVYVLRYRRPELARPFRVPAYPVVPAVYLGFTSALLAATFVEQPISAILAVAAILAGLPLHELTRLRSRQRQMSSDTNQYEVE